MKIYIDILIISNCIMTLVYLRTLQRITHRSISNAGFTVSSLIGGLFSLVIIMDGSTYISAVIITIIKWIGIILTLLTAVRFNKATEFFRTLFIYIAIRIAYTGMIFIYWQISDSKIIYVKNYTTYFDISLFKLIAAVISAYLLLTLYEYIVRRFHNRSVCYKAVYQNGDYTVCLSAVADTGNRLCDSFTGEPVVLFCCNEMYEYYNLDDISLYQNVGFRFVPYNTLNGSGLAAVTSKGKVTIIDDMGNETDIKCCVGILRSDDTRSRAIFDPTLLK